MLGVWTAFFVLDFEESLVSKFLCVSLSSLRFRRGNHPENNVITK